MAITSGIEHRRAKSSLILIPVIIAGLMIFSFIELRASIFRSQTALLIAASERISLRISGDLNTLLDIGQQFRSVLLDEGDGSYTSLKSLADTDLPRYPYIDSITIAPGAIIRYSFPEEGASASIGHDLLDNQERMHALVTAVSKKKAVLQGPDISAEGVKLAFLRIPVFRAQDLWGFVSIAIDVEKMMGTLSLKNEFPSLLIGCAAAENASASGAGERATESIFWGDERARTGYASVIPLGADNSEWVVYVATIYPASRALWWGAAIVGLGLLGFAVLLLLSMSLERQRPPALESQKTNFDVTPFKISRPIEDRPQPNLPSVGQEMAAEPPPEPTQKVVSGIATGRIDSEIQSPQSVSGGSSSEEAPPEKKAPHVPELTVPPIVSESEKDAMKCASVLVIDDSEVNRELLVRMLTLRGYVAESLASGDLALEMLRKRDFDVMLIDCIMPGMDGYELATAIRLGDTARSSTASGLLRKSAGKVSKAPVMIAMSPRHDEEEVSKCQNAGFDSLLIKPFTMTSLDQKIQEMLRLGSHFKQQ